MRARGLSPSFLAFSADMTSTAAAPSLSGQALPAVTVPSWLERGLELGELLDRRAGARPVVLGDLVRPARRRPATISRSKWPRVARGDGALLRDHRPLVLRLAGDLAALGDVLGGHAHRDVDVVERALGAVELRVELEVVAAPGARETASTPAAMYWSPSPALIAWKAMRIVCSDEAQKRLTDVAGT